MTRYLLDTHVWLWYAAGSPDLPRSLREALDDGAGKCWLSPISLWEVGMLAKKGRIRPRGSTSKWIEEYLNAVPVREAGVNFEVAKTVEGLDLPHGDPADHLIAATALVYELTLVTLDQNLVDAAWLPTLTR